VGDTEALGERLGTVAVPGTVLAFRGGLGAGKTVLSRGLARGLGISDQVTSPTYTLVNEYDGGRLPLYHIDCYRLGGPDEFDFLDARRYLYGRGICAIEWSERVEGILPPDATVVELDVLTDDTRRVRVSGGLEELLR